MGSCVLTILDQMTTSDHVLTTRSMRSMRSVREGNAYIPPCWSKKVLKNPRNRRFVGLFWSG